MELIVYVMVSVLEQGSQDDIRQRQLTIQPRYHTESDTELPVTSMWHVRNPLFMLARIIIEKKKKKKIVCEHSRCLQLGQFFCSQAEKCCDNWMEAWRK